MNKLEYVILCTSFNCKACIKNSCRFCIQDSAKNNITTIVFRSKDLKQAAEQLIKFRQNETESRKYELVLITGELLDYKFPNPKEEQNLINNYAQLTQQEKEIVQSTIDFILEKENI